MSKPVRHFLDINELPLGELRNMLSAGAAMKAKLKAHEKGRKPLEGKTLAGDKTIKRHGTIAGPS